MTVSHSQNGYSPKEETSHVITHGIGILLSIVGFIFLMAKARETGDIWHIVSFIIFSFSLFALYLSSTLYHIASGIKSKLYLRKLDHSAIYLLIAGTYTPFLLTNLRGTIGWVMFIIVWAFASVGIIIKIATNIRSKWVSAIIYLVMGWLAVFIYRSMIDHLPQTSILFLIAGGLFYTLGVTFYVWEKLPYHHAIWHVFVLGGSICHYFSVYYLL